MAQLAWFLNEHNDADSTKTFIIFCCTHEIVLTVHITLTQLSFKSVPLYGKLQQNKRLAALNKFKRKDRNILVATDVASRWILRSSKPMIVASVNVYIFLCWGICDIL